MRHLGRAGDNEMGGARADVSRATAVWVLVVLAFVAILLRLWGLGQESVWWDEFTSLKNLDAPTLAGFHELNRLLDPAALPLYYSVEYLWWHHVSASVHSLRLLSIAISLLGLPLIFGVGALLFNRRAGLLAATCLALSPIHIFHAQGIRMYVLFGVLALASLYTFARLVKYGKPADWGAHLFANFLLTWTHPFGLLIFAVQGLTLLLTRARAWRLWVPWGVCTVVLTLPLLVYLTSVSYWSAESTEKWFKLPGFVAFLADVFADDAINFTYQLRAVDTPMAWLPGGPSIFSFLGALGGIALAACALVAAGFSIVRSRSRLAPAMSTVLLLLWVVLPPVALLTVSLLWRPCIFPRYTLYGSFGVYLLLGAFVAAMPGAKSRRNLSCAIVFLFLTQIFLLHPGPQRTDWQGAANYVENELPKEAVVLVYESIWEEVFAYNLNDPERMVTWAAKKEELVAVAAWLARVQKDALPVTLLVPSEYFESDDSGELEGALNQQQLSFEHVTFPGIKQLDLYNIAPHTDATIPELSLTPELGLAFGNVARALVRGGKIGLAKAILAKVVLEKGHVGPTHTNLYRALQEGRDPAPFLAAIDALNDGLGAKHNGNPKLAIGWLNEALESDPDFALALEALFWLQVEQGLPHDATTTFARLKPLLPPGIAISLGFMGPAALDAQTQIDGLSIISQVLLGDTKIKALAKNDPANGVTPDLGAIRRLSESHNDEANLLQWLALSLEARMWLAATDNRPEEVAAIFDTFKANIGPRLDIKLGILGPGWTDNATHDQAAGILAPIAMDATKIASVYRDYLKAAAMHDDTSQLVKEIQRFTLDVKDQPDSQDRLIIEWLFKALDSLMQTQISAGRYEDAAAIFIRMKPIFPPDILISFSRLDHAIATKSDYAATFEAIQLMSRGLGGVFSGDTAAATADLEAALEKDPLLGTPHFGLALLRLAEGDRAGFWKHLRQLQADAPETYAIIQPFVEAVFVRQDAEAAARALEDLDARNTHLPPPLLEAFEDLKARGQKP